MIVPTLQRGYDQCVASTIVTVSTINLPQRGQYLYQSKYCEENIWQLCQRPEFQNSDVIVMASMAGYFPIFCQRAAESPDTPILWDYHVVLLWHADRNHHYILDFDTTLSFCTPAESYFKQSLLDERLVRPEYVPRFRLVSAKEYAEGLLSYRSHMKTEDGWLAEPPDWPPIHESGSNLDKFIDMSDEEFGQVLSEKWLLHHISVQESF